MKHRPANVLIDHAFNDHLNSLRDHVNQVQKDGINCSVDAFNKNMENMRRLFEAVEDYHVSYSQLNAAKTETVE